jgi:hypothetical protein
MKAQEGRADDFRDALTTSRETFETSQAAFRQSLTQALDALWTSRENPGPTTSEPVRECLDRSRGALEKLVQDFFTACDLERTAELPPIEGIDETRETCPSCDSELAGEGFPIQCKACGLLIRVFDTEGEALKVSRRSADDPSCLVTKPIRLASGSWALGQAMLALHDRGRAQPVARAGPVPRTPRRVLAVGVLLLLALCVSVAVILVAFRERPI